MSEEGEVIDFTVASGYPPGWYQVQLQDQALMINQNRVSEIGPLKPGDKVRFKIAKTGPYSDGATYLDRLEKIGEKAEVLS